MASSKLTSGGRESLVPPLDNVYPPNVRAVDPLKIEESSRKHRRQRDLNMKNEETQQAEQRRSLAHALEFINNWKVEMSDDNKKSEHSEKKYDDSSSSSQTFIIPTKTTNIERLPSTKHSESERNMKNVKKRLI